LDKKILVLGGTGMLGYPIARRLKSDGFQVRVLARNVDKAQNMFEEAFEIYQGDVTEVQSLENAMDGCLGILISIGGPVDQLSAEHVAALAPKFDLEHVIYLSGSTASEQNAWYPMTAQKVNAEKAIQNCGVPFTILRPTWPMEQLPRFVIGGRATVVGVLPPWHWFAAADLARMTSNAFLRQGAKGKCLYIHGPEAITLKAALERYCRAFHPEIDEVVVMPIEAAEAMAASTGNTFLKGFAEMMAYFKKVGEPGDSTEANNLLGAPLITLDDWIKQRRSQMLVQDT
jgi:uncharacterized protein YbjT (DUF2867 family)